MRRIALTVVIVSVILLLPTNLNPKLVGPTDSPLLDSGQVALPAESDLYSGSGEPLEYSIGGTTDTAPTTFSVSNGSSTVSWTAEVLIPQPNDTLTSDVEVFYPMTEWGPTKVIDSLGRERTQGTDWDYGAGKLTIYSSAVDVYGEWLVQFDSLNYMENLQLGVSGQSLSESAILNIGDDLKLRATSPWIENARVGLELKDPAGGIWHTDSNTTGTPSTEWHIPSFGYRIPLNISSSSVDADLTSFPLLVDITESDLTNTNKVQSDGDDIVFVQNGEVLSHELIQFTQSVGDLTAWVKTNLSSTTDNTVYMYYGNSVVGSTENATDVWTNSYEASWHLDETYSDEADGGVHQDSTSGGYSGVQHGNTNGSGIAGYAQVFDGTDDWISVNATEGLEPEGDVTLSGWFYLESAFNSSSTTSMMIMEKYLSDDVNFHIVLAGSDYGETAPPTGSLVFGFEQYGSESAKWTNTTSWSSGWYHYSCFMDADTLSNNKLYVNGLDDTNPNEHDTGLSSSNMSYTSDWGLGGKYGDSAEFGSPNTAFLDGSMDEVRVSIGSRSAAWISAEYDNQVPSSVFLAKGSPSQRTSPDHTFTKTIDSTAPAGEWTARTYYNDTGTSVTNKTGLYERNFIVKHDTSLILKSPGDAVGDQLTTKITGDMLYVVVDLQDSDNTSDYVDGATVTMNWTVDGVPTQRILVDHGNGTYSRTLNTTDLATEGRWRVNIASSHPHYNDATYYFDIDLSHETEILYQTPPSTPVGDDFTVRITVQDAFNGNPIPGASITSNGSLIGTIDNGDGTYDLTLNSTGLSTGDYLYHVNASPTETYLLQSTVDITFTLRDIHTATYGIGGNSVSTPYDIDTSFTVTYNDTDHGYDGISGASWSVNSPSGVTVGVTDNTDGSYALAIDVSGKAIGTYSIEVTFSKTNYEDSTFLLELTITQHDTFIVVNLDQEIPWGENSTFSITWYDSDTGDTDISSTIGVNDVTVNGSSAGNLLNFDLDCDDWSVGTYHLNVTVYSDNGNYDDAWTNVTLEIRAHHTYIEVNYDETVPWGDTSSFVVTWYDSDTGGTTIDSANLDNVTIGTDSFGVLSFEYDTSALAVGSYQRDVDVYSSNLNYFDAHTVVEITVRKHYTQVHVEGDFNTPWGQTTDITVVYWDIDTDSAVPVGSVDQFSFNPSGYTIQTFGDSSYSMTLDTSEWAMGTVPVTLTVTSDNSNENYQQATTDFDVVIRAHHTTVSISSEPVTPIGFDSDITVTYWDTDTNSQVPLDNVSQFAVSPTGHSQQNFPDTSYTLTIDTDSWSISIVSTTLEVTADSGFYDTASMTFDITIRARITTAHAEGNTTVPFGNDTPLNVVIWDQDADSPVSAGNVSTLSFQTTSYGTQDFNSPSSLDITLSTDTWNVGKELVTLTVSLNSAIFSNPDNYAFNVTIRRHYTVVTVTGDLLTPHGFNTSLSIQLTDSDTGTLLSVDQVDSIVFDPATYSSYQENPPGDFQVNLPTSSWNVGTENVVLSLAMLNSSYHNPANYTFEIEIRKHYTETAVSGDFTTPHGFDTSLTVVIRDLDTGTSVDASSVASLTFTTVSYGSYDENSPSDLDVTLPTNTWNLGSETVTLSVSMTGSIYSDPDNHQFDITIRKHYTSVSVTGNFTTPHGFDTAVRIVIRDMDTGGTLAAGDVSSFTFTPDSYGSYDETTPTDLDVELTTNTWNLGTESVTLSVSLTGIYFDPDNHQFDIVIRKHYTSISVSGDLNTPHGFNTSVTLLIRDLDTGSSIPASEVDSFTFTPTTYSTYSESSPSDLSVELDTDGWAVGTESITLSMFLTGSIYQNPDNHSFDIVIRKHYTSVSVAGNLKIPVENQTPLEIILTDLDTDQKLPITPVDSFTFTPATYPLYTESNPTDFDVVLPTETWAVGPETVTLSVSLSGSDYLDPDNYQFTVTLRKHYTAISVSGDLNTPHGFDTALQINVIDLDTGENLSANDLSSFTFNPASYGNYSESSPSDLNVSLPTSGWDLGSETVILSVLMSNPNCSDPSNHEFTIFIRKHYTSVSVTGNFTTPHSFDTAVRIVIRDTDTGTTLGAGDINSFTFTPASYGSYTENLPSDLDVTLSTNTWDLGSETVTLSVSMTGSIYFDPDNHQFEIVIRKHFTSISISGDLNTPYGFNTTLTILIRDLDTGGSIAAGNVDSFTLNPDTYSSQSESNPSDLDVEFGTETWDLGSETVTLSVSLAGSIYSNPDNHQFQITIRKHHTAVSVTGSMIQPYGNDTPVTVVLTDLDTASQIAATEAASFEFTSTQGTQTVNSPTDSNVTLNTGDWPVSTIAVSLSVDFTGSIYNNPTDHIFDVTIRRLGIRVTHEPTDLIIPFGDDFNIKLRVNVSELGNQYDGNPVSGLTSTDVIVENSTHVFSITWSELSSGRYNLTISNSELTDESYRIKITIKKSFGNYSSDYIVVEFRYRDARSYLSSPTYPQVTTPYQTDIQVRLNYTDVDRNQGITTATITIAGENISIYGETHLGDGEYVVTLNVTLLQKGDHEFNLTAAADQYEDKTLTFTLTIRIAYTYAIPTVGALDIPVGNDPVFYVDYWDTDHDVPVDNSSTPYTALSTTWNHTVGVTYLSGEQRYKVTFITEDDDALVQNFVVTFNFSKGENYQFGIFNLTVTIRTHNTDFRLVSAVDPTSSTGVFDISVYYGDLDNNIGIKSSLVQFEVWNESQLLSFDWENNTDLGDGFYILHVNASQFSTLGIKTFNVYANWTGTVYKYQNKTLSTTANLVGQESALTLLEAAEPTPYLGNMTYTLFFSDVNSGNGIKNDTGDVHIYVSFQGYSVDTSQVDIWEVDQNNQPGNYSIQFNTTVFTDTGRIYMDLNVNWSKGVEPFYTNRTDVISLRVLARDTLISLTPPSPTSYGENGTFSFTFEDVTGAEAEPILDDAKLTLSMNISFSYSHSAGTFTVEFNTTDFGSLGTKAMELNVTWAGTPFYANRTNRIVFVDVIARQTVLEYLAPAPTQYLDNVTFTVTWTDVTGTSSSGIEDATVSIYNGTAAIAASYYTVYEEGAGTYEIQFNTTFYDEPAQYNLNVTLHSSKFYYFNSTGIRQFKVLKRVTLLSSEPIGKVPYNSSITVILNYQDLYTLENIGNDSSRTTLEVLNGTDWYFTSEWKPAFGYYVVEIQTYNHPELNISDPTTLELKMSYEYTSPYYQVDTLFIEFELRIRSSSLSIEDPADTTPYNDNTSFTVFYQDEDAQRGITGGDIYVFNGSQLLNEYIDYTLSFGDAGFYEISLNTSALGSPGSYPVFIHANWTSGEPYHDNSTVSLSVRVRERDTNVEITVPPAQTKFLDNVTFSFVYTDLDAGQPITAITIDDVNIYLQNGTELISGYTLTQDGETFEISIPSDLITSELVSNYGLNVTVDWDESQSPYYSDDQTIVKVTVTNRIMSISLVPISTTPLKDNMTVNFTLSDDDTGDPISGVIVDFDCQDPSLSGYTLTEGTGPNEGFYSISFNTTQLNETGTYSFDLIVKWNPNQQPYYANLSTITLRGAVDLIYTSLQNDPPNPASVQYTDSVYVLVYFEDLDHGQVGIENAIMHVQYLDTAIEPSNLVVDDLGGGQYNITFDTSNLAGTGPQTLNVTAELWPYSSRTVTPAFTVTVISTTLVPHKETIELFWKESANVSIDYNNLLDGNTTPGATVTYSWDGGTGVFEDSNNNGTYTGSIDTALANAGTRVVTVTAQKSKFATSVTTLTLVVKTLPSEIIAVTPAELVQDIDRGSDVNITLYLNDTTYSTAIDSLYVDEVYATFQGSDYALSYNGTPGYYTTTIPGSATILPIDFYTVRLTGKLSNYDPASYQFKVNLLQTRTDLSLTGDTNEDMVAVYSEVVNFTVLLTAPDLGVTFSQATVSWYLADTGETGNFTNAGDGVYWVAFNTTQDAPGFGIWGLSFKARPYENASEFAGSTASLSLTVKKIITQVDRPPSLEVYWGWKGNISFTYLDLSFNDTIPEAAAEYSLSEVRGTATHVGAGDYIVSVDTSLLVPDTYQLSLTFTKENYQEATAVIRITVLEVPTEIIPEAPAKNRVENETTNLVVPVGETVDITFFYNDTDPSDGYVGGLENALNITGISHPSLLETVRFDLEELGDGYYRYSFDTTFSALYQDIEGGPRSSPEPYTLLVKLELANRTTATIRVSVTIIDIPTEFSIVEVNRNLLYGDRGRIVIYYNDTWHNEPVTEANLSLSPDSELDLLNVEEPYADENRPGYYIVEYVAQSPLLQADSASSTLVLRLSKENTQEQLIEQEIGIEPTQAAETLNTAFTFGTPISIVVILLLLAYIKIWSVPKRLRQINGQIKSLEKGNIPSPVQEAKNRQQLVAELFNDTYKDVEIRRQPAEMPSEAIQVEVPELGELLMMLSILTNLTPEELEDFKGDIDKMRPSEKAAFIKEVIHQEAIRAAKREDKDTEVIIEEVRQKARKRLRGEEVEEEPEETPEVQEVEEVEKLLLKDDDTPEAKDKPPEETPPDHLSPFELEELRKDLQQRGVPPHEIDNIMEQAERLPRNLVDELLESLDENGV